jgi:hypothetical protein
MSCKTRETDYSMSSCATANTGFSPVGYCLENCGSSQELVLYYYTPTQVPVAEQNCEAMGFTWVSSP